MKSNYSKIGSYIREVKDRNSDGKTNNLLGINIDKYFMPSVANIVGTDLKKYKIIKKGQFACNRMHVGRDKRLPVALSKNEKPFIVSPAYNVFEIIEESILFPEYLMMWFSRKEFDRNAWFYTDADVRGGLHWDAFCNMELPVPDIDKQKAIVKEYNTIVTRIKLNEDLNKKLEETAQAIYKQWFVDFEFPDKNGKPYKSNGGEMVYNEELMKETPSKWECRRLKDIINIKHGYAFKGDYITDSENENILLSPGNFKVGGGFKAEGIRFYSGYIPDEYVFLPNDLMVTMTDLSKKTDTLGYPAFIPALKNKKMLHNQRLGKIEFITTFKFKYSVFHLMCSNNYRKSIIGGATGTTVKHTSPTRIMDFNFAMSNNTGLYENFDSIVKKTEKKINQMFIENLLMISFRNLLLAKMAKG